MSNYFRPFFRFHLIWVILILFLSGGCSLHHHKAPQAVKGTMNLSNWNFQKDGTIPLSGEWSFYWNELYTPSNFLDEKREMKYPNWITLPRTWNGYQNNGKTLPGMGYATYRLHVSLGKSHSLLALKVPYASTSYRLWINGRFVASDGVVGTSKKTSTPQYRNQIVYIRQPDVDLLIQVSNFQHRRGGLFQPLIIGTPDQIVGQTVKSNGKTLFFFGALTIIGLYYLVLFALRRKARSHLYFGLICMFTAIHSLLVNEMFLIRLFPHFNWNSELKMEYLSVVLSTIILFPLFINHLFEKIINRRILQWILGLGFFYIAVIITTPPSFHSQFAIIAQLTELFVIVYLMYAQFIAARQKKKGAVISFLFSSIVLAALLNDILYATGWIQTGYRMNEGLYVFIFGQSLILAAKMSQSFSAVENLTGELKKLNQQLDEKVKKRTNTLEETLQKLQKAHAELEVKNRKIEDYEKIRQQLFTNISHELRTPITYIQGYLEALIYDVIEDSAVQKQYLQRIHGKTIELNKLISDLFELSKAEVKKISLHKEYVPMKPWLQEVFEKLAGDVQQAEIQFRVDPLPSDDPPTFVHIDHRRMEQALANIVSNAVKFTPKQGSIRVTTDFILTQQEKEIQHVLQNAEETAATRESGIEKHEKKTLFEEMKYIKLRINIADTGIGIPEEELPYLFQRFFRAKTASEQGSGLGLAIAKGIIESHGGHIWAESKVNEGSIFHFTLPVFSK